ncbi:MAG: BTB/POZ domain-containing protein [Chlamydiales bacterium]|nr:BTB/POZ domain-containing protein [Chlamydiales bacterium]
MLGDKPIPVDSQAWAKIYECISHEGSRSSKIAPMNLSDEDWGIIAEVANYIIEQIQVAPKDSGDVILATRLSESMTSPCFSAMQQVFSKNLKIDILLELEDGSWAVVGKQTEAQYKRSNKIKIKVGDAWLKSFPKPPKAQKINRLFELWRDRDLADSTIFLISKDGKVISEERIHRCVLATEEFFKKLYSHHWKESSDYRKVTFSHDCSAETFKYFIQYIYIGEVPKEWLSLTDNCIELLTLVDKLQASDSLRELCYKQLKENLENFKDIDRILQATYYLNNDAYLRQLRQWIYKNASHFELNIDLNGLTQHELFEFIKEQALIEGKGFQPAALRVFAEKTGQSPKPLVIRKARGIGELEVTKRIASRSDPSLFVSQISKEILSKTREF